MAVRGKDGFGEKKEKKKRKKREKSREKKKNVSKLKSKLFGLSWQPPPPPCTLAMPPSLSRGDFASEPTV